MLKLKPRRHAVRIAVAGALAASGIGAFAVSQATADGGPIIVIGAFHDTLGPCSQSPVGLCFPGTFSGSLTGTNTGVVNSISATGSPTLSDIDASATINTT